MRMRERRDVHLIISMSELGCQLGQAIPQNNNRHLFMTESAEPTFGVAGRQQKPAGSVSGLAPIRCGGQGRAVSANPAPDDGQGWHTRYEHPERMSMWVVCCLQAIRYRGGN